MNESRYYDLLIKTTKYSDFIEEEKVLTLLEKAYITLDKTSNFTRKSWQWYENVEIRIVPELKSELERYIVKLREWCNEIYEETEEYDIGNVVIKIGISKETNI